MLIQINNSSRCFMLGRTSIMYKAKSCFHLSCNVSILLAFHVVGFDFTVHFQAPDESRGTPRGIWTSEAARNIPSLYPHMHLCKLIFYSRHMPTSQDHKCPPGQTVKSAYCSNLLSHLNGAFVGWHGTNSSRSPTALLNQSCKEAVCCSRSKQEVNSVFRTC